MKLQIKNIGAIGQADIDLDGITIIAGENNVGKSTVGKTLYAFLHDMSSWKSTYDDICSSKIDKFLYSYSTSLEDWCMKVSGARRRRTSKANQLQEDYAKDEAFLVVIEDYQIAEDESSKKSAHEKLEKFLREYCRRYLALYAKDNFNKLWEDSADKIREWVGKAIAGILWLELDELKLQTQRLKMSFQEVFNSQYRKIGTKESQVVWTDDDDRDVKFTTSSDGEELSQPIRLLNRIFFIESPKIYDYLSDTRFGYVQKEYLRYLMSPNVFKKYGYQNYKIEREEREESRDSNEALEDIAGRLMTVMGGRSEFLQKVGLEFKDENIAETIHSVNVSTGLKSMALLEYALRIGAIDKGDILILDEPEINLHPEWQVEYARTLVDLQKAFYLKIVITTHSPYFMRAIECFSDVRGTMDRLNVYRVSRDKKTGETQISNVSYTEFGMTDLYDELSAPLEELEALLDEKYGEESIENS